MVDAWHLVPRDPSHRHRATLGCPRVLPGGGWCQEGRGNKTWSPTSGHTHGWAPCSHSTMPVPGSGLALAHCPFPESEEQPQRVAHVSHQSQRCLMPVFSRSEAARTSQEPSPQWCKAGWRNEWQLPGSMVAPNSWKSSPTPWDPHPSSSSASSAEGEQQSNSSHTDQAHGVPNCSPPCVQAPTTL